MRTVDGKKLGGAALILVGLAALPARADTTVAPGQEITLAEDVVLTGAVNFTAGAANGQRCKIHGNGFGFLADKDAGWTGTLVIRNCDLDGIGTKDIEAVLATVAGNGKVIIEDSTLTTSGLIELAVSEHVDVIFRNNVVAKENVFPEVTLLLDSPPFFHVTGKTDGMRIFQSNLIQKGRIKFTSTEGWTVGGSMPGDGNVMIGTRVGFELENASQMQVIGNYSHTLVEGERWNQVKNLSVISGDENIIEHNVFWGRNWLAELAGGGELRYNLLIDAAERGWVLTWTDAGMKIHHNVGIATKASQDGPTGAIVVEDARNMGAPSVEAYNNTFDLGGKCNPGVEGAVVIKDVAQLVSLRSNVFAGVRVVMGEGAALVRADDPTQPLGHMGYADYNLFYTPDSPVKAAYGAQVADKTVRVDDGFALHDLPSGGGVDAQTDPMFTGPLTRSFPFDEATILTRETTTCQILAYYRKIYTPAAGSPLIDAGDPMEMEGNDVGAVGAGTDNVNDKFGRLCDPADVGTPKAPDTACSEAPLIPPEGGGGGGGGDGTPLIKPKGITCVCDAGAAAPSPGALLAGVVAVLGVLAGRRRERR
jgi:hypothetical protein